MKTMKIKKMKFQLILLSIFSLLIIQFVESQILSKEGKLEVKIGVVINEAEEVNKTISMGLSCIKMALSDFYIANPQYKTRVLLHVRQSQDDVLVSASAILNLIKNEQVMAIIGPETSQEAQFVINMGQKAHVPIISYSASSPWLSPLQTPYFIRATYDDSTQVQPLCALIRAFGWREIVPVFVDNEFGGGMVPSLVDNLQQIGTRILYRSSIPSSSTDHGIEVELKKLKSMQTRVFVVHMTSFLGSKLFFKADELGMMGQEYVWIVTNAMADVFDSLDPRVIRAMQGVLGVKTYVPRTQDFKNFTLRWKMKMHLDNPNMLLGSQGPNVYGLWAYDTAIALARAIEHVSNESFVFQRQGPNTSLASYPTDLSNLPVSSIGQQLLESILNTTFVSLSGKFKLVNGQLNPSIFKLVNVVGNGEKDIGYWTPSNGLVRKLTSSKSDTKHSTLRNNLGAIIWPGDNVDPPKGWVASPTGKKLQIGIPTKAGFSEFIAVNRNHMTNTTNVTGYCIDVFDAVMAKLPYHIPYEYVPYEKANGDPAGDYNELIYQVYLKKFDAVIGDVTIVANRSKYVDFALPYTESGVVMVSPMKDNKAMRAWLFIKPLTWDLWVITFCSFIFIAFVIWVLEHRINEDFRGPPTHQVGTSLYYSFSTIVFSHSFSVFSNLTRFVVIIWVFVVLVLIQSYTANLASLLTVEQLRPTVTDVNELLKSQANVGHQEGSFVRNLLMQMNFNPSKLKSYNSTADLYNLFTKGEITAAFDEIPYVKLFLADHCSEYSMVPPTYKTDGFGFAFPIGSPLVSDVSRQVLEVTEGKEMRNIEDKWFKQEKTCPESTLRYTSTSLGLDSFWGLFTIAGLAALVALLVSLASFLHEHHHISNNHDVSVWARIKALCSVYDRRDLSSHTFKKSPQRESTHSDGTSLNITPYPQSPLSPWTELQRVCCSDVFEEHSNRGLENSGIVEGQS